MSLHERTTRAETLPNFFICGAAKAGTTTLYELLRQHPEVYLPAVKEPHFFDRDTEFAKGLAHYDARHYGAAAAGRKARGDATPAYLGFAEWVAPRIAETFPRGGLKFIVSLRDPVARAYSHYRHRVRNGRELESFADALAAEADRLADNPREWCGYFQDGLYSGFLEVFFRHFGRESVLILRFDDLIRDHSAVLRDVCAFLAIRQGVPIEAPERSNAAGIPRSLWLRERVRRPGAWRHLVRPFVPSRARGALRAWALKALVRRVPNPPMPAEIERELRGRYADEIDRLENLLGWDLSAWREGPRSTAAE
jgi:hypothetical protein